MPSSPRTMVVLVGLALLGAALGASAALLALLPLASISDTAVSPWESGSVLAFVGSLGAVLGAILGPLVMFTVLRYVPLGRAIGLTFLGAVIGGGIGLVIKTPVLGGLMGFFVAVIWLYERTPSATAAPRSHDAV